jgi:hypothetical protein
MRLGGASIGAILLSAAALAQPARAQDIAAPGYVYAFTPRAVATRACVALGSGGAFVGSVSGIAQSIVFISDAGGERTVATGLSQIADCAYDESSDVLYVGDRALDTVFAIDNASTASNVSVSGKNLLGLGLISPRSVALDSVGNIFVSDTVLGSVTKILKSNGNDSLFLTPPGAAGLTWQPAGTTELLLVASELLSGATDISRYRPSPPLAPPFDTVTSTEFGTLDLATTPEGNVIAANTPNGSVMELAFSAVDLTTPVTAPGAFSQVTSIDVDDFTGRIGMVASGPGEDRALHFLLPIDHLALGRIRDASDRRECLLEVYGVELAIVKDDVPTKRAVCVDGDPCDADNLPGQCTFPLGVCLNVPDPRLANCSAIGTTYFELQEAKPEHAELAELETRITTAIANSPGDPPLLAGPQCFFSDGVEVPVRVTRSGAVRAGKQKVKFQSKALIPKGERTTRQTELDTVKLVCEPAGTL